MFAKAGSPNEADRLSVETTTLAEYAFIWGGGLN